jgi:hypothetical protein
MRVFAALVAVCLPLVVWQAACGSNDPGTTPDGGDDGGGTLPDGALYGGSEGGDAGGKCALYQVECNGVCISANDPMNCGKCGVQCAQGDVCWAGGCTKTCPKGLDACGGWCVDRASDNDNCGMCGNKCPQGQGCVDGQCKTALTFPTPPECAGGGPPITVDGGATPKCTGNLAQTTFTWGVCSCKDSLFSSNALVDGWDSSKGPYKPGVLGGGVGANERVIGQSSADIWGPTWAAAQTGNAVSFSSKSQIHHDVQSGANMLPADLACGKDAYVAGDIVGNMTVAKTLFQSPGKARTGTITYGTLDTSKVVTVPPPCDCTNKIPVAAIVAWGKANNDNAKIGLASNVFASNPPARIDLPCGKYYLDGFNLSAASAIVVHGRTTIFIDGNIDVSGFFTMTLDPKVVSELDVFVSGTITVTSSFKLGSPAIPALTRLYVGSAQKLVVSSGLTVGGEIWAGNAPVVWESNADLYGAVFAGDFEGKSPLNVHHDTGVVQAGKPCGPPPGQCGSCKDCNNQACINGKCDMCTNSSQCCPPLVCQGGTCVPPVPPN